jgi:hypothetical protein
MSFVIEARMDEIKRMSNEQRASTEDAIDYITEKIERFSGKMTSDQCADWSRLLKFRQMQLALDDLALVALAGVGTLDTKKMMDDALETIRLYHASCKEHRVQQIPVRRPDSPYVCTEIFRSLISLGTGKYLAIQADAANIVLEIGQELLHNDFGIVFP